MGRNNGSPKGEAQIEPKDEANSGAGANTDTDSTVQSNLDTNADTGTDTAADAGTPADQSAHASGDERKIIVLVRHKTPHRFYRCAGLVLKQTAENRTVTEAQRERLLCDPWVKVEE